MQLDSLPFDRAAINRENSLKSTGPRTEAGKHRSSLNALRHGLTGQIVVMPNEDLNAYHGFTQSFHDDLKPVGALEVQLVQSLADDAWRLNRAKAMESNLFALGLDEKSGSIITENDQVRDALAIATALREQTKALSALSMHQTRIARTFERTLDQLRELQAERRARETSEMDVAEQLYQLHQVNQPSTSYDPAADGFVFSTAQIAKKIERDQRFRTSFHTKLDGAASDSDQPAALESD